MLQRRSQLYLITILFLAIIFQLGCRENTLINSKVAPAKNTIAVYDTNLPCITHTYFDDTVLTSTNIGGIPIFQAVGTITDPFFGVMTAATYFQLTTNTFSNSIYSGQVVDSVVLVLPYGGLTFGDTSNQSVTQTYQVYYLKGVTDTLGYSTNYYSYSTKATSVALSAPTTVNVFHLRDSFLLNVLPQNYAALRIPLDTGVTMSIIRNSLNLVDTAASPTALNFAQIFTGICVMPVGSAPATSIPYFRLDGTDPYSEAGILVYYHTQGVATDTDNFYQYYFNTASCAHFNNITRTVSGYPVNNLYTSTAANDSIIALENQPGASVDVVIPGLVHMLPPGIVINQAQLQLTLLPGHYSDVYAHPDKLYPFGISNANYPAGIGANYSYNILDRYPLTSLTPLGIMDGYVHDSVIAPGILTFTLGIPREVMASITAKNDTLHLHINGTQDYYGAYHMVAGGGSYPDPKYRPRLHIVYSKLNH